MTGRHAVGTVVPAADALEQLRHAFDSGFGLAPHVVEDQFEDLLAIRVGGAPYAMRLSEIAGIYVDKHITALPGAPAELIGLAGFRSTIVAVYDLRRLLDLEPAGSCAWLVLASANPCVGLAFDQLEQYLRVPTLTITRDDDREVGSRPVRDIVRIADVVRPILRIRTLLDEITRPHAGER